MKKYTQILIFGILGLGLFACSDNTQSSAMSDTEIGIRKVSLEDEKDIKLLQYQYSDEVAGASTPIERSFENAPPMIPHNIEDMLPITQDNNQCLACHDPAIAADVGAIPLPSSHTYNLRTNKNEGEVVAARFNCVLCHTPQANLAPSIGNTFMPTFRTESGKNSSNLLEVINEGVNIDEKVR